MHRLSRWSRAAAAAAVTVLASTLMASCSPPNAPASPAIETATFWLANGGANLKKATPFARPVDPFFPSPGLPDGQPAEGDVSTSPPRPKGLGRVYFVDGEGQPRWCAGIAVTSPHRNVVATAGSCATGRERVAFVPEPITHPSLAVVHVADTVVSHFDWEFFADSDHEYTFIAVHKGVRSLGPLGLHSTGPLSSGAQDIAFNTPTGNPVDVRGFRTDWPIAPWVELAANDGGFDETFDGLAPGIKGEELQGVRSSNAFATSIGSAWLTDYDPVSRTGVLTGITIGTAPDESGVALSISPRLGGEAQTLFNAAAAIPSTPIA